MPNKVLKQFIIILLGDDLSLRFDDISGVLNDFLSFCGELVDVNGSEVIEYVVNLFIVRQVALAESLDCVIDFGLQNCERVRVVNIDLHTLRSTSASLIALLTGSTTEPLAGFVLISLGAVGRDMAWLVKSKTLSS